MAYTTISNITNLDSFINAFCTFAINHGGFTDQGSFVSGSTHRVISKGGIFWTFTTAVDRGCWTTSYDRSNVIGRMTYSAPTTRTQLIQRANGTPGMIAGARRCSAMTTFKNLAGPYTSAFFFTDGNAVHIVLEIYSGVFNHLSFGSIEKLCSWTGGEYLSGGAYHELNPSAPSLDNDFYDAQNQYNDPYFHAIGTYVHHSDNIDSYSITRNRAYNPCNMYRSYVRWIKAGSSATSTKTDFAHFRNADAEGYGKTVRGAVGNTLNSNLMYTNRFNMRAPASPLLVEFKDTVSGHWMPMGKVPNARMFNTSNITPKSIVENEWQAFPLTQRSAGGDASLGSLSNNVGIMYKRTGSAV